MLVDRQQQQQQQMSGEDLRWNKSLIKRERFCRLTVCDMQKWQKNTFSIMRMRMCVMCLNTHT